MSQSPLGEAPRTRSFENNERGYPSRYTPQDDQHAGPNRWDTETYPECIFSWSPGNPAFERSGFHPKNRCHFGSISAGINTLAFSSILRQNACNQKL